MNCSDYSDKLIQFMEKLLPEKEAEALQDHIDRCDSCRADFKDVKAADQILRDGSLKVKQLLSHPLPEELTRFVYSPETLKSDKKTHIETHVFRCPLCRKEMELISESPIVGGDIPENDVVFMPALLKRQYDTLYPNSNGRKTQTVDSCQKVCFWDKLKKILSPSMGFAYVSAAIILLLAISLGVFITPSQVSLVGRDSETQQQTEVKYVEFALDTLDENEKLAFYEQLKSYKVNSKFKNGKVYVSENMQDIAKDIHDNIKLRETSPLIAHHQPLIKGEGRPPVVVRTDSPQEQSMITEDKDTGHPSDVSASPNIAEAIEKTIDYPVVEPVLPHLPKSPDAQRPGTDSPARENLYTSPPKDRPLPSLPSVQTVRAPRTVLLVGMMEQASSSSMINNHPSIRHHRAFLEEQTVRSDSGSPNLNSPDLERSLQPSGLHPIQPSSRAVRDNVIFFDNPIERQKRTTEVQRDLQNKIEAVLRNGNIAQNPRARVSVILSEGKNHLQDYAIRSVTIHIYHSNKLSNIDKAKIKENIQREMPWDVIWDEHYEFHQVLPQINRIPNNAKKDLITALPQKIVA